MSDVRKDIKKNKAAKVKATAAAVVSLSSLCFTGASSALAATATLPILANLVNAVQITINTTLDFGTLAMTLDRAGEAVIDPASNKLFIDNSSSLSLAGGKPQAGRLQIKGSRFPVAISLENSVVKLTNGISSVSVVDFNLQSADGGTKITVTPTTTRYSFTIPVGATLKTQQGQLDGSYVGSTRIFANYQ